MRKIGDAGSVTRRTVLAHVLGAGGALAIGRLAFAADAAQVTIDNFTFSPTPLSVAVGTTVTWTNRDDIPHSIVCPALNFHSRALDTDDSFSFRFQVAGTYDYLCGIHPHMHGQIIVRA
jgi:plastocyanin